MRAHACACEGRLRPGGCIPARLPSSRRSSERVAALTLATELRHRQQAAPARCCRFGLSVNATCKAICVHACAAGAHEHMHGPPPWLSGRVRCRVPSRRQPRLRPECMCNDPERAHRPFHAGICTHACPPQRIAHASMKRFRVPGRQIRGAVCLMAPWTNSGASTHPTPHTRPAALGPGFVPAAATYCPGTAAAWAYASIAGASGAEATSRPSFASWTCASAGMHTASVHRAHVWRGHADRRRLEGVGVKDGGGGLFGGGVSSSNRSRGPWSRVRPCPPCGSQQPIDLQKNPGSRVRNACVSDQTGHLPAVVHAAKANQPAVRALY